MSDSEIARSKTAPFSRSDIYDSLALGATTLTALVGFACCWLVDYRGHGIQLLLVGACLLSVTQMIPKSDSRHRFVRWQRFVLGIVSIVLFAVWAPSFAFAWMLITPVLVMLAGPILLRKSGYRFQLLEIVDSPAPANPILGQVVDPLIESSLANNEESITDTNSDVTLQDDELPSEESTVWDSVQMEFQRDPTLVQNIACWQTSDTRSVVAMVRCPFEDGQQVSVVHIPFWPVLQNQPELYCRVAQGSNAEIKTTDEERHGIRLEVRRTDLSCHDEIVIEVVATSAERQSETHAA